jgi:hypothetical protein
VVSHRPLVCELHAGIRVDEKARVLQQFAIILLIGVALRLFERISARSADEPDLVQGFVFAALTTR